MAKGPIGKPKSNNASSISHGRAPSRISLLASLCLCASILFPTKPGHTPTTAAIFCILLATASELATTDLEVLSPLTISNSFITLAGLKKCKPITSSGLLVSAAISFTSKADVLEANMAPSLQMLSSCLKMSFLRSIFSNTASMIKS